MNVTELLRSKIVDVADFPTPGIVFKDISPLLADHEAFVAAVDAVVAAAADDRIDKVVGIEARGFLLAETAGTVERPARLVGFHWTKQHPGGVGEARTAPGSATSTRGSVAATTSRGPMRASANSGSPPSFAVAAFISAPISGPVMPGSMRGASQR